MDSVAAVSVDSLGLSQSALPGRALMPHLDGAIGGGTVDSVGEHVHADGAHGARVAAPQQARRGAAQVDMAEVPRSHPAIGPA